jgi:hypothetical protein
MAYRYPWVFKSLQRQHLPCKPLLTFRFWQAVGGMRCADGSPNAYASHRAARRLF